jgi:hypothetical protein
VEVFTEQDDYKTALARPDVADWVWQWASDKQTAINQHLGKLDEWEVDPTRETY